MTATRRPRQRRLDILSATADLIAERGFASVGIDEIAAAVGVTGPAIYRHFRGKDALLAELLSDSVRLFAEQVTPVIDADAGEEGLVAAAVTFAFDHPARLAAYLRERGRLSGAGAAAVADAEAALHRAWTTMLQTRRPHLGEAAVLLREAAATGALSVATTRRTRIDPDRARALLTEGLLGILAAESEPPGPSSVPRAAPPWRPPPARRDQLLAGALRLFRRRGFDGVGIDEIGEVAGISGSAVYRHFPTKAAILVDAFDLAAGRVAVGMDDALRTASSAPEALRALARSYATVAADAVDLIVVTSREARALPDDDRARFARRARGVRDTWLAVLAEARPEVSEPEGRLLVATTLGLVHHGALVAGEENAGDLGGLAQGFLLPAQK